MNKSRWGGGGGALPGQLGTDALRKDCETYPKRCAQNIKNRYPFDCVPHKKNPISLCSQFVFFFFLSDLRKPTLFQLKCQFSDPKGWQRCALPSLKKVPFLDVFFFFFFFFVQASVPSRLVSPPPSPLLETNVSPSMTYAHRIPPACRVMPTFFFSSSKPNAHRWAYSIGKHPSSVVRCPSVHYFQRSSSQKPMGQLKPIFMWRLYGSGEGKFLQTVMVTWPRWPPCP